MTGPRLAATLFTPTPPTARPVGDHAYRIAAEAVAAVLEGHEPLHVLILPAARSSSARSQPSSSAAAASDMAT